MSLWIYSNTVKGEMFNFLLSGIVLGLLITPDREKQDFRLLLQNFSATEVSLFRCTLRSEMLIFARVWFYFLVVLY